jgi:hypothetical protein
VGAWRAGGVAPFSSRGQRRASQGGRGCLAVPGACAGAPHGPQPGVRRAPGARRCGLGPTRGAALLGTRGKGERHRCEASPRLGRQRAAPECAPSCGTAGARGQAAAGRRCPMQQRHAAAAGRAREWGMRRREAAWRAAAVGREWQGAQGPAVGSLSETALGAGRGAVMACAGALRRAGCMKHAWRAGPMVCGSGAQKGKGYCPSSRGGRRAARQGAAPCRCGCARGEGESRRGGVAKARQGGGSAPRSRAGREGPGTESKGAASACGGAARAAAPRLAARGGRGAGRVGAARGLGGRARGCAVERGLGRARRGGRRAALGRGVARALAARGEGLKWLRRHRRPRRGARGAAGRPPRAGMQESRGRKRSRRGRGDGRRRKEESEAGVSRWGRGAGGSGGAGAPPPLLRSRSARRAGLGGRAARGFRARSACAAPRSAVRARVRRRQRAGHLGVAHDGQASRLEALDDGAHRVGGRRGHALEGVLEAEHLPLGMGGGRG